MGGCNARTGSIDASFNPGGEIKSLPLEGSVASSPLFTAEPHRLYAASMTGLVIGANSEESRWSVNLDAGVSASPALNQDRGVLFVATLNGDVYALESATGKEIWRIRLDSRRDRRIVADLLYLSKQNVVIACSWGEKWAALDAASGQIKQTWSAGYTPYAAAAADEEENFYFLRSETDRDEKTPNGVRLIKVSVQTGQETSLHFTPEGDAKKVHECIQWAAPVIDRERHRVIFITNKDSQGTLYVLSLDDGRTEFQQTFERHVFATPALRIDGSIVVSDLNGNVQAFSPDGSRLWQYPTGAAYLQSSPVCDQNGTVWASDIEGRLHQIDNHGVGKVIFEARRSIQARPSFAYHDEQAVLLIPSMDGNIYAIW